MCGIAGIFAYKGATTDQLTLTRMRETMIHRGPDGGANWLSSDGRVGLAHRRLSIVDLSDAATQPMANEDSTVWVTYNGEMYTHARLRVQLVAAGHQFRTDHSDTEVIVHGYEQWGMDGLLARIEGDYAIALWDATRKLMFLARDRIGVKPLYFSVNKGRLLFASEIKGILAHPDVERDIEPIAMYHYLSFLVTPAPFTMFKGIFKLPAGFVLEVSDDGIFQSRRYWDALPGQGIDPSETKGLSDAAREHYYVDGIRERLTSAVEKRMMSDVPFGVFLSGGVDSSTNVALMSKFMTRPVDTFTVGFKDHEHLNELAEATLVANEFKTNHRQVLIDESDMRGYLEKMVHHQDEPIADWVCIPLYFVSKLARDSGITVVQVGEGSDEQFCGYASYMAYLELYRKYWRPFQSYLPGWTQRSVAAIAGRVADARPSLDVYADIIDRASQNREHFWSGAVSFWERTKRQLVSAHAIPASAPPQELVACGLIPPEYQVADSFAIVQSFNESLDRAAPGHDILARMTYNEFKLRLPELLLMRVDKIGMSCSLEARVPFLDHNLVQFSMDIPMAEKVKGGEAKYLLKKAVEGLIPHQIIYRKKMGFGAPMSQWMRGDFGQFVQTSMARSKLFARGFFQQVFVDRLIADHRSGRADNSLHIWTLFNLSMWFDQWIDPPTGQ